MLSSTSLETAIALNNHGARLFQQNTRASVPIFQRAMSLLRALSAASVEDGSKPVGSTETTSSVHIRCAEREAPIHKDGSYFVYQRPLLVDTKGLHTKSPLELESVLFLSSTVLLFNMALAFHTIGLESQSQSMFLTKAAQLYDVILRCLVEDLEQQTAAPNGDSLWLDTILCLVLSNRAPLYLDHCHYASFQTCLDLCSDLLLPLLHQTNESQSMTLCRDEIQELWGNIWHAHVPDTAGAA